MRAKSIAIGAILFLSQSVIYSQVDTAFLLIDTIVIRSSRLNSLQTNSPSSLSIINAPQIISAGASIFPLLQSVPGVYVSNESNMAQDIRLSVRGFGARSSFGIRGVKLIVDGVPETTPDGQGQVDNLDPSTVDQIELVRSPFASQYGNASGGVVNISTYRNFTKSYGSAAFSADQYGSRKYILDNGVVIGESKYQLSVSHLSGIGYRDFSESKATIANLRASHTLHESAKLKWQLSFASSPTANDPGGLNLSELTEVPRQARSQNINFQAGESITHGRASVQFEKVFKNFLFSTQAFSSIRSFEGRLPFENGGWISFNRNYLGHHSQITHYKTFDKGSNRLLLGYELASQVDDRQRFDNLLGVQGGVSLDQRESFGNTALFLADQLQIQQWHIEGGLRLDHHLIKSIDNFLSDGSDDSGNITLNALSPSLGVTYELGNYRLFTNYNRSFETPALVEYSNNPSGDGFNENLKPQIANSFELGWKFFSSSINVELAAYIIKTDDELIPFEIADFPGRTFYRNAGQTDRKGLEISMMGQFSRRFTWQISANRSSMKFKNYTVGGTSLDGNTLSGIPQSQIGLRLNYDVSIFQLQLMNQWVDSFYLNDENTVATEAYQLIDLSISRKIDISSMDISIFCGIRNLLNQSYIDNARINAFGGRYYEPGAQRRWEAGVKLAF